MASKPCLVCGRHGQGLVRVPPKPVDTAMGTLTIGAWWRCCNRKLCRRRMERQS